MWNNHYSRLILIRISFGGWRRLVIPIPLFVLDIIISSVSDLATFADLFAPLWRRRLEKHIRCSRGGASKAAAKVSLSELVRIFAEFFKELRKLGRWRMVEVATDEICVYLDFY